MLLKVNLLFLPSWCVNGLDVLNVWNTVVLQNAKLKNDTIDKICLVGGPSDPGVRKMFSNFCHKKDYVILLILMMQSLEVLP